jgi:hypothetical protein
MKLVHVKQARSVWLFDIQDLNPTGKDVFADVVDWIKESYHFAVAPDLERILAPTEGHQGNLPTSGLVFQRGSFQARTDSFVEIGSLTLYNDGMVVDTLSSTQESDQFAGDLLGSTAREFGLAYEPDMIRKRLYVSALIIRSETSLNAIHPGLAAFAERISEALENGPCSQFQLAHLGFWSEPNDFGVHKVFSFMPQAGKALSEHRYFSEAPLKTADHLRLLDELEQILLGMSSGVWQEQLKD